MRPISLELSGFTSFRESARVDFGELGLFAITGQTGAGKTSLLDAITWVLYGKTARLSKAGRELVSQGATAMEVLLHFRAGSEEYRVLRRVKGAAATVAVRLEYLEGSEWEPITGNVRELDEQIRQIIGLDFDGFNKSVILPQGQFDVFLRGKAEERRAVLAELLDISVYQRMMQSANEKSGMEAAFARQKGLEIDDSVSAEAIAERQSALAAVRVEEKEIAAALKTLDAVYEEAIGLGALRKQLSDAESLMLTLGRKVADAERRRVSAVDQVRVLGGSVSELEAQVDAVRYDSDEHLRLAAVVPVLQQSERLKAEIATAEQLLTAKRERAVGALAALESATAAATTESAAAEAANAEYQRLAALDRVTALRSELTPGCECPVCEQTVSKVPALVDAKKLAAAKKACEKKSAAADAAARKLDQARSEGERAARELAVAEGKIEPLQRQLDSLAVDDQPIDDAVRLLAALVAAKKRRDELSASLESARHKLRENEMLQVQLQAEVQGLETQIGERRAANDTLRKDIDRAAAKVRKQLPEMTGDNEADWIRRRQADTRAALEAARRRAVTVEAEIARLQEKLSRSEQLRSEIAVHQREATEYKELATWLNAGNFQQFLLDAALERLAQEGSRHLEKLSAGRYQFWFRDKEFLVRDAWHGGEERSVSTLSGGESFLASLSLALALAEGIAQLNSESGRVVLESLFLDEGFSTLDGETLATVADALMVLQSGDRLIGIITHVPGLADQMPATIDVEKTIAGSRIRQRAATRIAARR